MEISGIHDTRKTLKEQEEMLKKIQKINQAAQIQNDLRKNDNYANNDKKGFNQEFDEIFQKELKKLK